MYENNNKVHTTKDKPNPFDTTTYPKENLIIKVAPRASWARPHKIWVITSNSITK